MVRLARPGAGGQLLLAGQLPEPDAHRGQSTTSAISRVAKGDQPLAENRGPEGEGDQDVDDVEYRHGDRQTGDLVMNTAGNTVAATDPSDLAPPR